MKEVVTAGNIIVFIDELHTLVGAGEAEGSIDASNMLKPALSRGEIQCIGATTLDEYRKYIEKDGALKRRFQPIHVNEPPIEEAERIILGLRDRYEEHHGVVITDVAVHDAVVLSERYVTDRFLPDKAIDIIDEAGARAKLKSFSLPPEIKELDQLLKRSLKGKEQAIKQQNFEEAVRLRTQEDILRKQIDEEKLKWKAEQEKNKPVIGGEEVSVIVSKMTGIPLYRIEEVESQRLLKLEEELHRRVVGQDEAISAVARAIRRSRAGIKGEKRPIGSFIFLGPTGVGKTELARTLAETLFGDEDSLIRVDMSEYMERFNVSRLTGAPPGYVGYEEGGQLTEKVRRRPYSVILFDEIEKAHPDMFNVLLQILDDGFITDSLGRKVDFKNTVLIMTSNLGARAIEKEGSLGFQRGGGEVRETFIKNTIHDDLKRTFNPEFLNRVDEIVVFHPLNETQLETIVDLRIQELNKRLEPKGIVLEVTPEVKKWLVKEGYEANYGARPMRRAIQRHLEDRLSEKVIAGLVHADKKIKVVLREGQPVFIEEESMAAVI